MLPYPTMTKELAVAAVTVLSFFLIGGCGGRGTVLRAAVLILTLLSVVRLVVPPVRLAAMAFTVWIAVREESGTSQKSIYMCRAGGLMDGVRFYLQTLGGALMGPSTDEDGGSAGGRHKP